MKDKFGREIDSLRVSVTQNCNLNCPYCHKEGNLETKNELSLDEINNIMKESKKIGIKKIKITGGEPLLRKDIVDIVRIAKENNFEDISLVTNGILLHKYAKELKKAGLNRVNIGCDSPSSNILLKNIKNIKKGLESAKEAGLKPIKLNMVVLKDTNDKEIGNMIEFARENNAILQLIELINLNNEFYKKHFFDLKNIEEELEKKACRVIKKKMQNRKQYDLGNVLIEVIRPSHKLFCKNCRRIRVTSDGKLKPCLMRNDNLVEFNGYSSFIEAIKLRDVYNG